MPTEVVPRPEVVAYANSMEVELRKHDDRAGWQKDDVWDLFDHLKEEVDELELVLLGDLDEDDDDVEIVQCEAADVGNMAMMVADVVRLRAGEKAKSG